MGKVAEQKIPSVSSQAPIDTSKWPLLLKNYDKLNVLRVFLLNRELHVRWNLLEFNMGELRNTRDMQFCILILDRKIQRDLSHNITYSLLISFFHQYIEISQPPGAHRTLHAIAVRLLSFGSADRYLHALRYYEI